MKAAGRPHFVLLCVTVLSCLSAARAQPVQPESNFASTTAHITLGRSVYPLNGPWKFSIGDSPMDPSTHKPLWAEPSFDDAHWETVDLTPERGATDPISGDFGSVSGWTAKGHPGYSGYAWYRIRVQVEAPSVSPGQMPPNLALAGPPEVDDSYQVFADGALLGSFGGFAGGKPVVYMEQPMLFLLPPPAGNGQDRVRDRTSTAGAGAATRVLALRLWMAPSTITMSGVPNAGGMHSAPLLGEETVVTALYHLRWLQRERSFASDFLATLFFALAAAVAFSLALFDRSDRVYLWIGAVLVLLAIEGAATLLLALSRSVSSHALDVLFAIFLGPLTYGGWLMVWWVWFRLQRPAWLPKLVALLIVVLGLSNVLGGRILFNVPLPAATAFHGLSLCIRLAFPVLLVLIVALGVRRQGREGWLALPAALLQGVAQFQSEFYFLNIETNWHLFGVRVSLGLGASVLLVAALFVLLLRRLLLSVRAQRLVALDVKQAQEIQQVIVPQAMTSYPGLTIQSEYRPAREVGGDFFQIIPHSTDNSLLIVAGDVTGKGLPAGMLVALLVGAIRTAAQYDPGPLSVLNTLNLRLVGRGSAAATCLALRIAADGAVTLANAGHLPPYLNAEPLAMEGALPLGIFAGAEFTVMHFQFKPGDKLLILSDGIVEATDANGELFGFDRIQEMLRNSATATDLIHAAQAFGQQDDISLIAITRTAALDPALA